MVPSCLEINSNNTFGIALVRYSIGHTSRVAFMSYDKIIVYCITSFILINLKQFKSYDVESSLKSMVVSWY